MNIKEITYIIVLSIILLVVTSCSNNDDNQYIRNIEEEGLEINATLDTRTIPAHLTCNLYVFWKATADTDYVCKDIIMLDGQVPYQMKFMNHELEGKTYRFFFMAVPKVQSKLNLYNASNTAFSVGDNWSELIVRAEDKVIDQNYYHGFVDKTGSQLLATTTIRGDLERLVGQIVLDIYRINNTINNPMPIQSAKIASVLDRVYQIDIQYSNLTQDIGFDMDGNIVEKANWATAYTHSIIPVKGDTLQVNIPQESIGIYNSAQNVKGSVRITGAYGLTSSPKIRAKYEFKYYDTTPMCGNSDGGNHTIGCYDDRKSLVLNLPQVTETQKLLSILPNYLTVNKAGIRLDRIIDLQVNNSYELETIWGNERN